MPGLRTLGVILAGGKGSRLGGRIKALEMLGGLRLIDHVIARARDQVAALLVSANDPMPGLPDNVPVRADRQDLLASEGDGRAGPLSGILAGLAHADAHGFDFILTFAGDTPFVPRDLGKQLRVGSPGIRLARENGQIMPVFGLWPVGTHGALAAVMASGERSIASAARQLGGTFVDVVCGIGDSFQDLDTPEDLACLTALLPKN